MNKTILFLLVLLSLPTLTHASIIPPDPRGYIGEHYDVDTDLNYLNARYYDAKRGQFISQDPVFWAVGDPKEIKRLTGMDQQEFLKDPQRMNSYGYGRGNPITNGDPQGLWYKEFITGQQSWSSFQGELGEATQYAYQNDGVFGFALDHPYATGAAVGLAGGGIAYGSAVGLTYASINYLGGIGTTCIAFCGEVERVVRILNQTDKILSANERGTVSQTIGNQKLQDIFNKLYQGSDKLPGGTAGAIKYEQQTGNLLSPSGHLQKGFESINRLSKILQNTNISQGDRSIAQTLLSQLQGVARGK